MNLHSDIKSRMSLQGSRPLETPQPLSLNDLLRQHCRDRLYIKPLHWTAQHLQLLKCRFVSCQHTPQPRVEHAIGKPKLGEHLVRHGHDIDLREAVHRLAFRKDVTEKQWGLSDLLEAVTNDCAVTSLGYVYL